jgi:glycosyltransferase involved in cell wall biosynthesis
MRLAYLTDWTYPCDHRFLTEVYAKRFVDRGHEIVWVMRPGDDPPSTIQRHSWLGQSVYVLPERGYDPVRTFGQYVSGRFDSHPLASVFDELESVDCVQVRNDLAMGMGAAWLKQRRGLPYVHQLSHLKAETLRLEARREWPGITATADLLKASAGQRLRRHLCSKADLLLPISESMQSYLGERGYTTPMEPVPTGANTEWRREDVDPERFEEEYDVAPEEDVLLYTGSMHPVRNLEFLFDVLQHLRTDRPVRLFMVGGREQSYRERLQSAARKRGIEESVTFTGWIEDSERLYEAIAGADIGLSPLPTDNVLRTSAPIKVLEYLLFETPVVVTDAPDQRRVVEESGAGVVTAYDPDDFGEGIAELLARTPDERRSMGSQGREYVEHHRSFEQLTDRVTEIYRRHQILE